MRCMGFRLENRETDDGKLRGTRNYIGKSDREELFLVRFLRFFRKNGVSFKKAPVGFR